MAIVFTDHLGQMSRVFPSECPYSKATIQPLVSELGPYTVDDCEVTMVEGEVIATVFTVEHPESPIYLRGRPGWWNFNEVEMA